MRKEQIEEFGSMFRLLTPILVTFIGTLILMNISDVKKIQEMQRSEWREHLVWAQNEVKERNTRFGVVENRVTIIEQSCCEKERTFKRLGEVEAAEVFPAGGMSVAN